MRALERDYIGRGACPGGAGKVLKEIIAVPGDRVSLDARGLRINGQSVTGTEPTAADDRGRPLGPLEFSETVLPPQSYWVGVRIRLVAGTADISDPFEET